MRACYCSSLLLFFVAEVALLESGRDDVLATEQRFNKSSFVKRSSQYVKRGLLELRMVEQIVAATRGTGPIGKAPDSTDLRPR